MRTIRFVTAEKDAQEIEDLSSPVGSFSDGEDAVVSAARGYLDRVLELDAQSSPRMFGADDEPTVDVSSVQRSKLTSSSVVRFAQTVASIAIFGSDVVVEVDAAGKLVGVQAALAADLDTSPQPTLDADAAVARVAALGGSAPEALKLGAAPTLTFFRDEEPASRWHLAWHVRDVPIAPPAEASHGGHRRPAHGPSPRRRNARFDVLVDAHDGAILLHYSNIPCAKAGSRVPVVPVRCRARDALGVTQELYGTAVRGGFELTDPQRKLRTFDFALGNIAADIADIRLPATPVQDEKADFASVSPAAVSAHVNVGRVWDFFNGVLQRDSVDDEGMELVSVVNCTSCEAGEEAPADPTEWDNAVWWEGRMWYGQVKDPKGSLVSYATCLDIIGHELTHGVTEHSAGLIYQGQSGALNESFSDIMGIVIQNWYTVGPEADVRRWTWELAPGHGDGGGPMRSLADPTRTGDPAHMKDFVRTRDDSGGVHTNSNIHNKAAYNLFTAVDASDALVFTPREVATLYYLCLVRLPKRTTFGRVLTGLLDAATTYYAADPDERKRKLRAIERAYHAVGITADDD
jgi:Zn-dependent metalloprotease